MFDVPFDNLLSPLGYSVQMIQSRFMKPQHFKGWVAAITTWHKATVHHAG